MKIIYNLILLHLHEMKQFLPLHRLFQKSHKPGYTNYINDYKEILNSAN